jgi:hypothetical protein
MISFFSYRDIIFLPELTFSTYPHKPQNLSFNLVVKKFWASKDIEDIGKTNVRRTLSPCILLLY